MLRTLLDHGGGAAGLARILRGDDGDGAAGQVVEPPAQIVENGGHLGRQFDPFDIARGARTRIFDVIGTIHDQYQVVVEEYLQPIADAALRPPLIVCLADSLRSDIGRCDAFDLAQYAGAAARNCLLKLLLLAFERHLIRSPRGGESRNDEANHRDGNDHADR